MAKRKSKNDPTTAEKSGKGSVKSSSKEEFLKKVRENNPMVEYITRLNIMNPAAKALSQLNEPRREGGFVRLAHAREEFTAPVLNKGKSVIAKSKQKRKKESK